MGSWTQFSMRLILYTYCNKFCNKPAGGTSLCILAKVKIRRNFYKIIIKTTDVLYIYLKSRQYYQLAWYASSPDAREHILPLREASRNGLPKIASSA